jgi:hypothetical protein
VLRFIRTYPAVLGRVFFLVVITSNTTISRVLFHSLPSKNPSAVENDHKMLYSSQRTPLTLRSGQSRIILRYLLSLLSRTELQGPLPCSATRITAC